MDRAEAPGGAKLAAVPVVPHNAAAASTSSGPAGAADGALGEAEGEEEEGVEAEERGEAMVRCVLLR
jgi:hypothetical protein